MRERLGEVEEGEESNGWITMEERKRRGGGEEDKK